MNHTNSESRHQHVLSRLLEKALVSEAQLSRLVWTQPKTLRPLIDAGLVPEGIFADIVSKVYQSALVARAQLPKTAIAETHALASFLIEHDIMPLSFADGELSVAVADPSDDFALKVLKAKLKCTLNIGVGVRTEILEALTHAYASPKINQQHTQTHDVPDDLGNESDIVRELHRLIQRAVSLNASDIHFEPVESRLRVRFRVHGMLRNMHYFEASQADQVIARLKLMAKLDVTERRHAQNGRFKFPADGRVIDLRVSTLPLHDGESIVLRLLEFSLSQQSLTNLGFSESIARSLEQAISTQQGLILITGPTGSGKSTTVYSLLNQLNTTEQKLISIEDPVELNIAGINQIQVDEEHGVSFAAALKTVLRQDPDVIMIGEIRDAETANLAAQAALTGHLVLATLHTSSAASAITRLQNLGLADYLIAATVRAVLAQRLLRCVCNECVGNDSSNQCPTCAGSKYAGRTTIAELLPTSVFGSLRSDSSTELSEASLANKLLGGKSLADDAKRLLASKVIDQAEVFRILGVNA